MKKNESLSRNQLRELQWRKLMDICTYAYEHVPFYRDLWNTHGVRLSSITTPEAFAKQIPVITKDDVRDNFDRFKSDKPLPGTFMIHTSGTTGSPAYYMRDGLARGWSMAGRFRGRSWWGVNLYDTEFRFWGEYTTFTSSHREKIRDALKRFKDRMTGIYYFSTLNTTEENLARICAAMQTVQPPVVLAYSSAVYILSRFCKDHTIDMRDSDIKVISYTAEYFLENQKQVAKEVFGDRLASEYGSKENGIVSFECPGHTAHIMEDDVYLESTSVGGEKSQLVATNLNAFSFPLIRYCTEDEGTIDDSPCQCGLPLRTLHLNKGRVHDYIKTPEGRVLVPTNFEHAMLEPLNRQPGVRRYQLVQHELDRIEIFVETNRALDPAARDLLIRNITTLTGEDMKVAITETDRITLERSGKFKFIISHLSSSGTE